MMRKKICLLGSFAVGKTSMVRRFVHGQFSDKYLTTVGVKIDKKELKTPQGPGLLMVWDLSGDDQYQQVRASHLKGMAGYLLVVDGTRPATLEVAEKLVTRIDGELGRLPFVLALNKSDLADAWCLPDDIGNLATRAMAVVRTSAKSGVGVEACFNLLGEAVF